MKIGDLNYLNLSKEIPSFVLLCTVTRLQVRRRDGT